jgi:predicted enzyme related to lactoylglutathione lyase
MKLGGLFFDVPAEHEASEVAFWSEAFGVTRSETDDADDPYTALHGGHGAPFPVEVQRLGSGGPRIHIDVESDDVDADAERLEALGATRVERIESWWVMKDPAGIVFCIVPAG